MPDLNSFFLSPSDACKLTLDPNTAHRYLSLSEDKTTVTLVREEQSYPHHPERFLHWKQLLCTNGLTGRCYWEVVRKGWVSVGVTYRGIGRRETDCCLGLSDRSWSLCCSHICYSAFTSNRMTAIYAPISVSERVAVYLDWPAGILSFYTVSSDRLTHLHTFQSTFTEPVYPAFGFEYVIRFDSSLSLCQMEEEEEDSHFCWNKTLQDHTLNKCAFWGLDISLWIIMQNIFNFSDFFF